MVKQPNQLKKRQNPSALPSKPSVCCHGYHLTIQLFPFLVINLSDNVAATVLYFCSSALALGSAAVPRVVDHPRDQRLSRNSCLCVINQDLKTSTPYWHVALKSQVVTFWLCYGLNTFSNKYTFNVVDQGNPAAETLVFFPQPKPMSNGVD